MITDYGAYYWKAQRDLVSHKEGWSYKRSRMGQWIVFEKFSGSIHGIFRTKLRAYYEATVLNKMDVSQVFRFSDGIFTVQE